MSTVMVAWLAVLIAPADNLGVFVRPAVAAYMLAGVIGAWCCRQCCATEVLHAILCQPR